MYEDIKTACLYVRFSSHNQTEQSIEGQTRVCRDFCKRHNIRIVEIYADRATSASKDIEKRVQFLKMIKDSEKGLFDAVIVYKLDRFARSRYDSATYKYRLKRNGVQLISATENISNDPEGIILESVLEGMAEFYSAELSQKINRGMRESAYKHNSIGGAVPLGYKIEDKKLVIDPKTAPIVKEAFEKYADGETVAEICRQFNARGYKTSKGTAFGKSSFTKIFRNERYIGVYSFHDYRAEDAIPAIIDKDLWDRVQLRVGKIKNAPARNKAKVVYLLSGKIFCGHCGSKMNGNCNAGNYYYYQCYGKKNGNVDCKKKNIRKEFIERLVAQDALSLLTDEYIEQIATIACEKNQHEIELDSALPTIRDRIHQVDLSLNNLLKAIESGSAPDMLVKRMGELEKEKKDLQVQAKKESEDIVELDKAQVIYWLEQFRGGSIEDEEFCRMLIDLFVNSVTVWDEDDNTYKVTVAYNLTSLPTKTYRLNKGGTLSDFTSNAPAWVCAGPPGRNTASCFLVRPVAGGYPPCSAPQELAHPALLRPAHPLYRCIRDLQLYLSAGCAGVHPWACPGKAALSGAFSSHSGCGVPVHPALGPGAPPLHAGTQKPVGSRSGERCPCQNTAAPAGRCAAAVEPQCAGPVCSGLFRSFPAGLQRGSADRPAEHPRHAAARPCAVSVGDPLLRLFTGLQGHHSPVHHHRIPLRLLP